MNEPVDSDKIEPVFEVLDVLTEQEEFGTAAKPRFFLSSEAFAGRATSTTLAILDLYEYDRAILVGHDVDFSTPYLPVHSDDFVAGSHEVLGGDSFAMAPDGAGVVAST